MILLSAPSDSLGMSGVLFGCHNWGVDATSIQWVKAKDAIKNLTLHRTSLTKKNFLAANASSAKFETHCTNVIVHYVL